MSFRKKKKRKKEGVICEDNSDINFDLLGHVLRVHCVHRVVSNVVSMTSKHSAPTLVHTINSFAFLSVEFPISAEFRAKCEILR